MVTLAVLVAGTRGGLAAAVALLALVLATAGTAVRGGGADTTVEEQTRVRGQHRGYEQVYE